MTLYKSSLLAISLTVLIGCGGGGSNSGGSSTPAGTDDPIADSLSKTTLTYSQSPTINKELKLSIEDNTSTATTDYSWEITSQPASSNVQLNVSTDSKSLRLTPSIAGQYKITATPATGDVLETQFSISKDYSFDETKLKNVDATEELSQQTGLIQNQIWVFSESLTESEIKTIVQSTSNFSIIGFDEIRGLLVEFDETLASSQTQISKIRLIAGIDSVDARVFKGSRHYHESSKIAEDGSKFDDGGDNWHLEHIGITDAWDISTGSDSEDAFYIGVAESIDLFHTEHEDLKGRFKEATKADLSNVTDSDTFKLSWHATAVAGAIGAISNNKKGVSGINWSNQIIGGRGGYAGLLNIVEKEKVKLINNSYSIPGYLANDFSPDSSSKAQERFQSAYDATRDIRKLTIVSSDQLFTFAAGNGIGNGRGFKGFYGVDAKYENAALQYQQNREGDITLIKRPNVMIVAAHANDNRLAFYSSYGEGVDIAAPAGYKAPKAGDDFNLPLLNFNFYYTSDAYGTNNSIGAFRGTSSATPVVTGVASLMFAADETLTPSQVKNILISSATEFVTERYIKPGNEDTPLFGDPVLGSGINIETLADPIPVLNAASALKMTKEIKQGRVITAEHTFADPFTPTLGFNPTSANGKLELNSYKYQASAKENGASGGYVEFSSGNVASFNPLFIQNIGIDNTHYKIDVEDARFSHEATGINIVADSSYEFIVPLVTAITTDKDTQVNLPNVSLEIQAEDSAFLNANGATDATGNVRLYLAPGLYKVTAKAEGYNDLTQTIKIEENDTKLDVQLGLVAIESNPEPETGNTGENLKPNTPLTSSETSTIPNISGVPGVTSLTTTEESGFDGAIKEDFSFIDGVTSLNAVDIQRDIGISVVCEGNTAIPVTLDSSDFSTATLTQTVYQNGQQVASCSSTHQSILPLTLTNSNLFGGILEDWGSDTPLSSNCPTAGSISAPPLLSNNACTSVIVTNYLITDDNGVEHKISTRLTTVPNE